MNMLLAIINGLKFYQLNYVLFCVLPSAILTGMIAQRYGARKCGVLGSVLFSGGLLTSWFATSTIFLQVSFGIVSGKNFNPFQSNGRRALFQFKGCWVGFFFISIQILMEYYVRKKVKTLIRYRVLRLLIGICTVCICPTRRTVGQYMRTLTYCRFSKAPTR